MGFIIGSAGHVDHGKTTLIHALTGIDADRLPEEKARGMTLDIGFAYIDLPRSGKTSIIDVPGHQRYLSNMLVGAHSVDIGLLCVSAVEGPMPQTKEHLEILSGLDMQKLVVALTFSDLVDLELISLSSELVAGLLNGSRFENATIIPVSAKSGVGIPELVAAIDEAVQGCKSRPKVPWYLPIDRAFLVKGRGVVVTGTLMGDQVSVGDIAQLEPLGKDVRIRGIQSHGDDLHTVQPGNRTALQLAGIELQEIHRGQVVCLPGAAHPTQCFEATFLARTDIKNGLRVRISIGSDEVMGRIFLPRQDGELWQIRLERDTVAAKGQKFLVRQYSPPKLIGDGRVEVPRASPRQRSSHVSSLEAESDEGQILELVAGSLTGVTTAEICKKLGRTPQLLGDAFEQLKRSGQMLGFAGRWFTEEGFDRSSSKILSALTVLHEKEPGIAFQSKEKVLRELNWDWEPKALSRFLAEMEARELLRQSPQGLASAGFLVRLNSRQEALLAGLIQVLDQAGAQVPSPAEAARIMGVPPQAAEEIAQVGIHAGRLVRIEQNILYSRQQLSNWIEVAQSLPPGFSAADFRDAIGASRKYVIPLLEWMDAKGITIRNGDLRRISPKLPPLKGIL